MNHYKYHPEPRIHTWLVQERLAPEGSHLAQEVTGDG
jgi:hypothetical protein